MDGTWCLLDLAITRIVGSADWTFPFSTRSLEDLMDHFVSLDRLPEGFEFPADFKDRIGFDPQAKRLFFRGYMSKTEFDHLSQLTRDWSFRRKLEELFQLSIYENEPRKGGGHGFLSLFRKRTVPS
jgi:hypothetical protein